MGWLANGDNFRRRSCFPYYSFSANFRECPAVSVSAALLQVNLKLSTTSAKSSFKGRGPFLLVPFDSSSFFHAILNLLSTCASLTFPPCPSPAQSCRFQANTNQALTIQPQILACLTSHYGKRRTPMPKRHFELDEQIISQPSRRQVR